MPKFRSKLTAAEIEDLAHFVIGLREKGKK
jgi:hypothetical protein